MTMGDRLAILNDGRLQQVGKPTEVYENPVNRFVAGFIGSPSMNFVEVDVDTTGTTTLVNEALGFELPLSDTYLRGHDLRDSAYTLGIRPENVDVVEDPDGSEVVTTTVEVVEPIGSDNYVHLALTDDFLARSPPDIKPEPDDVVGIDFDETNLHLFDPETGEDVFLREAEPETVVP